MMDFEEKNHLVEDYIRVRANEVNKTYNNLVDERKIREAISKFTNSTKDFETEIIPEIEKKIEEMIAEFLKMQGFMEEMQKLQEQRVLEQLQEGIETHEELAVLDLNTNKNGLYLSQQQIDLLMITDLNSKEEMKNYVENICGQFPYKKVEDVIPNFNSINNIEQLELAKRELYYKYQDSLIDYLSNNKISDVEKAKVKLKRLGIEGLESDKYITQVSQGNVGEAFRMLGQDYGSDFITKFNHSMNDDFENVRAVSYEQMKSLSDLIKRDSSIDTMIIATGKFDNTILPTNDGPVFDPYLTSKALDYCYRNGKHVRYHSLFDHAHVDELLKQGKGKQNHDQILSEMREFVRMSMEYISQNNRRMSDGTMLINEVEVFNELVEKNKYNKDSKYEMVWEKYFGITTNELVSCFEGIQKPAGVEFMYNETTLTENKNKRDSVERVLFQIEQSKPGLIDRFGDQMHLSNEDVYKEGKKNLTETAQMIERIQRGELHIDGQIKRITPLKTECTEHDFHFTPEFKDSLEIASANNQAINPWRVKRGMQYKIEETYKEAGVNFERCTYWSIFNENDHNLCRANGKIEKENMKEKNSNIIPKPLYDSLGAGIPENGNFTACRSLAVKHNKVQEKKQTNQNTNQQTKAKQFTKKMNNNPNNHGLINPLFLGLVALLLVVAIVLIVYFLVN